MCIQKTLCSDVNAQSFQELSMCSIYFLLLTEAQKLLSRTASQTLPASVLLDPMKRLKELVSSRCTCWSSQHKECLACRHIGRWLALRQHLDRNPSHTSFVMHSPSSQSILWKGYSPRKRAYCFIDCKWLVCPKKTTWSLHSLTRCVCWWNLTD